MVKRIHSALTSHSLDTVLIGLEATSVYGDNPMYLLRENATLAPLNRKIHVLNHKQVKKFHDSYNNLPKNDYVWTLLSLLTACVSVESTKRYIWKTIATMHFKISHGHDFSPSRILPKKKQRFMNILFKKYSMMTQEKVFSDTFSTTALACLR